MISASRFRGSIPLASIQRKRRIYVIFAQIRCFSYVQSIENMFDFEQKCNIFRHDATRNATQKTRPTEHFRRALSMYLTCTRLGFDLYYRYVIVMLLGCKSVSTVSVFAPFAVGMLTPASALCSSSAYVPIFAKGSLMIAVSGVAKTYQIVIGVSAAPLKGH